ncbi:MAG: serine/threonine-protein phosphatase [Bacteroidia bacterium]|nr:serine/threonine-protein phosphatase [Bacteroidia bacterium]MDW8088377.1 PP2C family protein-serine/threonine phosphatase [Bacteroidia bacterium]
MKVSFRVATALAGLALIGLLLYAWLCYFPSQVTLRLGIGLLSFLAGWIGGHGVFAGLVSRRWRTPHRLLRWNALLVILGLGHTLVWALLTFILKEEAEQRIVHLLMGILEIGILSQLVGHLVIAAELTLTAPTPQKRWTVVLFVVFASLVAILRALPADWVSPALVLYSGLLLWIGLFPILYFSQWLQRIAPTYRSETLFLIGGSAVALFLEWQIIPSLLLPFPAPLLEVLHPILLITISLHAGWLILPLLIRFTGISTGETDVLWQLTEFLAKQQRSASISEVIETTAEVLQQLPSVRLAFIEVRDFNKTYRTNSTAYSHLGELLHQVLRLHSGTDSYVQLVESLQKKYPGLPDVAGILVQRPIARLSGAALQGVLSAAVLARERDGFEEADFRLISTLLEQTALFLENLDRQAYQEQLLTARKEADFLRETREALLPPPAPILRHIDFHVVFEPYDRTIGGDYYQIHEYPDGSVDFLLLDSAGSGIAAAYQMAQARGALNTLWLHQLTPEAFMLELNDALRRVFHKNNFIAVTLLRIDPNRREYTLLRAGSPEVLYWNPLIDQVEVLRPSGIVLGNASSQIIGRILTPERGRLMPGSTFVCFSDGFTEASNAEGEMFGVERIMALFQAHHDLPARQLAQKIQEAAHAFVGSSSLGDDGTLIVARFLG